MGGAVPRQLLGLSQGHRRFVLGQGETQSSPGAQHSVIFDVTFDAHTEPHDCARRPAENCAAGAATRPVPDPAGRRLPHRTSSRVPRRTGRSLPRPAAWLTPFAELRNEIAHDGSGARTVTLVRLDEHLSFLEVLATRVAELVSAFLTNSPK